MSIFAAFRAFAFFAIIYLSRKDAENAKYAKNICPFSHSVRFSAIFRGTIIIAKGRGKREIRENYISLFEIFRAFAFVSQFYILSRKDAENARYAKNIYHFSQPFALSHFFAILYFIAKGRGKRGIRGNIYTFRIIFDFSRFFAIGSTLADYY